MGEDLDPFGRRRDENPLASLGWHGEPAAGAPDPQPEGAAPEPVASPLARAREPRRDPAAARRVPPAGRRSPTSRGAARVIRAVFVLAILVAVLGAVVGTLVDSGVKRVDRFARELAPPQPPAPVQSARPALPARGLSSASLLRPAAFARALARLRHGGYGRLTNLRVAPDRIDATMLTGTGGLRQVQIVPGGAVRVLGTSPSGFAGARTMTLKGIDARAPSRLTRSAAGRLEQATSRVDYLVLSEFAGARQWYVYFAGGHSFSADPHGRITRRIS